MNQEEIEIIISEWEKSKQYTDNYTTDFPSLDNIVDGIPINHKKGNPYVGDTTLAGLVRAIPRDSLQQLPVFAAKVNGTKNSIKAQIASFLLRNGVFNEDTFGKGLLSTMQIGGEQALTHGYAPFMTATGSMHDDFGTTMRLIHYADCAPEPGIQDASESGYFYVRANLTKSRIKKMIDRAEANPNTSWNIEALKELYNMSPTNMDYSIYQSDARSKDQTHDSNTYEVVTRYEVEKFPRITTFSPQITDKPLRTIKGKSKFGYPRVNFLVIDPAALSPFGISRVRLASPNQNLMNAYYQNVAAMFILNSKPPVLQRGRFLKPIQLKQGVVWQALDPNAKAELVEMSNGALSQFVPMAKQMSAQIQNIMGSPRGSIGADSSNLGYSKTAPGVKAQREDQDLSINQITNILENFLRQYALSALDIYVSEQTGDETLILDDDAKNAINRIAEQAFKPEIDPITNQPISEFIPPVGDDNTMEINWEEYYESIKRWSVEIELSINKDELEEKKRSDIQDQLVTMTQNLDPNDIEGRQRIRKLEDLLLEKSVPEFKDSKPATPIPYQGVENQPPAPPVNPPIQ